MQYVAMYSKYTLFVIINLFNRVINFPLAPIVVLFASEDGWLPKWLWWFQTPDNPLDGDGGWITLHRPYNPPRNKFERWVNRWRWLWRNCMYGFSQNVTGFVVKEGYEYWCEGDERVSNRPIHEGLVERWFRNGDGRLYFQWFYVKIRNDKQCWRINLGWKLWGNHLTQIGDRKQCTFSPSFTMGYADKA